MESNYIWINNKVFIFGRGGRKRTEWKTRFCLKLEEALKCIRERDVGESIHLARSFYKKFAVVCLWSDKQDKFSVCRTRVCSFKCGSQSVRRMR